MERDLQVLVNTRDHLVVDSPAGTEGIVLLVGLGVLLVMMAYVIYRVWSRSKVAAIFFAGITLAAELLVYSDRSRSYRMDLDRSQGQLIMTTFSGTDRTDPLATERDPLNALTRADMEFDHAYRRITLSTANGQHLHPLGPDFEMMDSQFNVLGDVQKFLRPSNATPGAH